MRIIVLSDTHGNPKVLETILARHADADACIHLGDGEGDVKLFLSCHPEWESKFYAVRGNCDFNSSLPISRTIDLIPGHRIFAVHGHRHAIRYTPDILVEEAIAEDCNIVLHGHTHVRRNEYRNGVYLIQAVPLSHGTACRRLMPTLTMKRAVFLFHTFLCKRLLVFLSLFYAAAAKRFPIFFHHSGGF